MSTGGETAGADLEPTGLGAIPFRIREAIRSGNLGSWPVVIVLAVIVVFFGFTADNFFSPVNFNNIIVQMAGTTMLAYGVVFVLLIGEIDLSIGFVSGVAGVVVAELQLPGSGHQIPDIGPIPAGVIVIAIALLVCAAIGLFQGSIVALIGVPAFVVTLAGLEIWQGVIQKATARAGDRDPGQYDQQHRRLLLQRPGGLGDRDRRRRHLRRQGGDRPGLEPAPWHCGTRPGPRRRKGGGCRAPGLSGGRDLQP